MSCTVTYLTGRYMTLQDVTGHDRMLHRHYRMLNGCYRTLHRHYTTTLHGCYRTLHGHYKTYTTGHYPDVTRHYTRTEFIAMPSKTRIHWSRNTKLIFEPLIHQFGLKIGSSIPTFQSAYRGDSPEASGARKWWNPLEIPVVEDVSARPPHFDSVWVNKQMRSG